MIKQALSEAGLAPLSVIGLMMFVSVFVGVAIWTLTRERRQIDTWSSLPLADGHEPIEPRIPTNAAKEARNE